MRQREEEREFKELVRKSRTAKSDLPPYLTKNSWEHELNYKLWVTKGARFHAAKRCEDIDAYGVWATTILSSYLIIVGLIPYIPHPLFNDISPELLGFGTTSLSILLLTYSLIITSRQYPVQARSHHECALKIGFLYDALRQAKEVNDEDEKRTEIARITREYETLLPHYANHRPIDHDMFQTTKPAWYKLSGWQVRRVECIYYFHTRAILDVILALGVVLTAIGVWQASLISVSP